MAGNEERSAGGIILPPKVELKESKRVEREKLPEGIDPNFIFTHRIVTDPWKREIEERIPLHGEVPEGFPRYVGMSAVRLFAEGMPQAMVLPFRFKIDADSLPEAFSKFDELGHEAGQKTAEEWQTSTNAQRENMIREMNKPKIYTGDIPKAERMIPPGHRAANRRDRRSR